MPPRVTVDAADIHPIGSGTSALRPGAERALTAPCATWLASIAISVRTMSTDVPQAYPPQAPVRTEVNIGRLWAGGVAAAVVAALIALVGLLVARALFRLAALSPKRYGAFGDDTTCSCA